MCQITSLQASATFRSTRTCRKGLAHGQVVRPKYGNRRACFPVCGGSLQLPAATLLVNCRYRLERVEDMSLTLMDGERRLRLVACLALVQAAAGFDLVVEHA